MNLTILVGRVVKPEWREMKAGSGMMALKFSLCVENEKRSKTGERKIEKMYMQCIAWGKTGEPANNIVDGQEVHVTGSLKQDTWPDKETGKNRYAHSLVVSSIIFDKSLSQAIDEKEASPFEEPPYDDNLPF